MFLDAIRSFLDKTGGASIAPAQNRPDPVHVAACALMLDITYADGEFSAPERAHLEGVFERHFSLPPEAGRELIALCEVERAKAVDHFQFTRVLRESYDVGQKMVLAEIMWGLVLADGQVADHEHYLTRKIANLLELEPGYLSAAKQTAQQRVAQVRGHSGE
jgi:uncharacterized tellurite resistance protein B-like protein